MPREKIPRGKCHYCGQRRYVPWLVVYNDGKNCQGICWKCFLKHHVTDWPWLSNDKRTKGVIIEGE